jgi:hypothetical protein
VAILNSDSISGKVSNAHSKKPPIHRYASSSQLVAALAKVGGIAARRRQILLCTIDADFTIHNPPSNQPITAHTELFSQVGFKYRNKATQNWLHNCLGHFFYPFGFPACPVQRFQLMHMNAAIRF